MSFNEWFGEAMNHVMQMPSFMEDNYLTVVLLLAFNDGLSPEAGAALLMSRGRK